MKLNLVKGQTDVTVYLFILDSSSTTGAGKTGIVWNDAFLIASYVRPLGARTAISPAAQTVTGAHSDGGFVEIDSSHMPGIYRFDLPDAVCAAGADSVIVMLKGPIDMAPVVLEIQLIDIHPGYAGPHGHGVYYDDSASNTDTQPGIDGTEMNPVSSESAARAVATSLGLRRIYIVNDSVLTLAATYDAWEIIGIGDLAANSVAIANQDVSGSVIYNCLVTGQQGGSGRLTVRGGAISGVTDLEAYVYGTAIVGNITLRSGAGNDSYFDQCWGAVPGNGTPDLTFAASADVCFRHYDGNMNIKSMASSNTMSCEMNGQITIDATCLDGALAVRGNCTLTDNAGGAVSITDDARIDVDQINAEVDTALSDIALDHLISQSVTGSDVADDSIIAQIVSSMGTADWDTFINTTDSLQAMRDRGDAAWVTYAGMGSGLTAIPWNAAWDAEVQSECNDAMVALGLDLDIYQADIDLTVDEANSKDEYTVAWFKNGVPVTSGITLPKIQVVKRVDGTDLVAETTMTQIGATSAYKYDEPSNRITAGEAVVVVVKGTIDGSVRTWRRPVSRDSS